MKHIRALVPPLLNPIASKTVTERKQMSGTNHNVHDHDAEEPDTGFWNVKELSRETGASPNCIYEAIARGEVPGVIHIGKRIIISKKAFLEAATTASGSREA